MRERCTPTWTASSPGPSWRASRPTWRNAPSAAPASTRSGRWCSAPAICSRWSRPRRPGLLPGAPVRRVTRAPDGIVVEQQLESGEIIRLYERLALAVQPPAAAKAAPQPSARRTAALDAAAEGAPAVGERLARYVGAL